MKPSPQITSDQSPDLQSKIAGFDWFESVFYFLAIAFVVLLVVAIAMPPTHGSPAKAKRVATLARLKQFSSALETYKTDIGNYPSTLEGLEALVTRPIGTIGWHGPYIPDVPLDYWGRGYRYEISSTDPTKANLFSSGPDGIVGNSDDIHLNLP